MGADPGTPSRTLVIFPGALGDLICLLPALRAISERHPDSSLDLMARYELARFAAGRTPVSRAYSIDRPEVARLFSTAAVPEFFTGFARIYSFFAADHHQFRQSLAAAVPDVRFLPFPPVAEGHIANAWLRAIGRPDSHSGQPRIELLPADLAAATAVIVGQRLAPGSYLLLLPGSGSRAKNWPAANFVALATRFAPRLQSLAVLGPAEAELAAVFHAAEIATVDGLELGTVAALATQAAAFVGNDSGVSHLAAATGASGVALFGPTDPARWRPLGRVRVLRSEPLANLPVEQVADALWPANPEDCQLK